MGFFILLGLKHPLKANTHMQAGQLKLNHVANLHDARYAASQGVGFVSFAMGKGLPAKLPEHAVAEMLGWLEGPTPVLDFGTDLEGLLTFVAIGPNLPSALFQLEGTKGLAAVGDALPGQKLIFREVVDNEGLMCLTNRRYQATQNVGYHEVAPTEALTANGRQALETLLGSCSNVILDIDTIGIAEYLGLRIKPAVAAFRSLVAQDLLHLDFDRFEALQSHLGIAAFEL